MLVFKVKNRIFKLHLRGKSSMSRLPEASADGAWFFDFDGTLAEIAQVPAEVKVPEEMAPIVERLARQGVAIAVISGRSIAEIDSLFAPLKLPAAGVHGSERRDARGCVHRLPKPDLQSALNSLQPICAAYPDLLCEVKPGAIALHYRRQPQLGPLCIDAMEQALQVSQGLALLRGKMVVELKSPQANKGAAVRAFLAEEPFRGRCPWYFGDDLTDEPAFRVVQAEGGVSVKVGDGQSVAAYRLASTDALYKWLEDSAAAIARSAKPAGPDFV